jgi:nucleoside-diphosphate-sugar epimerase
MGKNILAAALAGVKRLVFLSSIKVNGEETFPPSRFKESDAVNPQDPYAISKYEAEQALYRVANETGLEVVVIRPPLVYGPNVKGNLKALLKALSKNIPMPLASVNNKRDFVGLGNLLDAMILCGVHPQARNQTYLISDGHSQSTSALIKTMSNALGVRGYQFHFPVSIIKLMGWLLQKSGAVSRLIGSLEVDTTKIRSELDWTPPQGFEEGVQVMVGNN